MRRSLTGFVDGLPRVFWILWGGVFVNRVGTFVVPFMAVYLTDGRGFSVGTAGLVAALYGLGSAVASQVGGALADHLGRRTTMLLGIGLGGVSMVALGFASDLRLLMPLTFVAAVLNESYRPALQATVADIVPPRDRSRAFGALYWAANLGVAIGLVLGGALAEQAFVLLFVGDGLTTLAFGALVWRLVPETRPAPAATGPGRVRVLQGVVAPYRDLPFLAFLLLNVMLLFVFMQHATTLPIDAAAHGISKSALGWVLAVNAATIVVVQPVASAWLARLDRGRVLAGGAALVAAGFGSYGVCESAWGFAGATLVWSLGEIAVFPITNALVADVAPSDLRGRYQGALGLSWGIAGFGAPLLGTAVLEDLDAVTLWGGCFGVSLLVAAGYVALGPTLARVCSERTASFSPAEGAPP
ncbi:MAG: MFS transporter [Myxococcales bacterium]